MDKKEILQTVVEACVELKAENCVVLDTDSITSIADYFVICSGTNERQVQAIARAVKNALDKKGFHIERIEGMDEAKWVLLDLDYVICHIFNQEERSYYNLERLWGDAAVIPVEEII